MAKGDKKEIGKGIRALLEKAETRKSIGSVKKPSLKGLDEIPLEAIETNPFQPRNDFDRMALEELATSIKTFGLIQPITLRRLNQEKYQLISGERRLKASKMAGLKVIPAFIRTANDQEMLEMALVENIQRADLNAIEIAISYQRLIDECKLTHESLSSRVGKQRSTISNYIRLLKLPPPVQKAIKLDKITMGHARALLSIVKHEIQLEVMKEIIEKDLSVRATERLVKTFEPLKSKTPTQPLLPAYQKVADDLSGILGTKVHLKRNKSGKGSLTIHFTSDDDLNRILDRFDGN